MVVSIIKNTNWYTTHNPHENDLQFSCKKEMKNQIEDYLFAVSFIKHLSLQQIQTKM